MVGAAAVVLVVVLTVRTGPGDLTPVGRLVVFGSTLAFSTWLLREHRRRIPPAQRWLLFVVCAASLVVLFLVLAVSAL